ncbi:hypothetical protein H4Q26_009405 [Puccinia striiformis f. sp. tritici PST-130]|nr:hypothetical protein H4Q26_009405 [Puccinia striiformis f. sp. tritici PST-130]
MDFDSGNPAGNIGCAPGMWELEILPAISSAGNHDPDEDIHPTHPADPPGRSIIITGERNVTAESPMAADGFDQISSKGMSPLVYVSLKDAIEHSTVLTSLL